MRFRAPYGEDVLDLIKAIPALPIVLLILGLAYLADAKDRLMGPDEKWRRWFAWFPVRMPDTRMAWLEWTERQRFSGETRHRTPTNSAERGGRDETSSSKERGEKMKMPMQRTMRAEMKPDCYGGKTCDKVVPRWNCYADGDKEDEDLSGPIKLDPRTFPPGTTVVVCEPVCPECGETRPLKFPPPKRGSMFDPECSCGFDWEAWTLTEYS